MFAVWGVGCGVWGVGCGVRGQGFGVWGVGVQGFKFGVPGFGSKPPSLRRPVKSHTVLGLRVWNFGFEVSGIGYRV